MSSIRQDIAKGVFWIAVAKYSGVFISLGITAILARNVSPSAFGTMAVATVITAFLDIFIDMGFGAAIIQFKDLTKRQINSIFMVSTGIGLLLAT
ncbi:oligosaccharide flippase family protein, partial [uncultured Duncaniella sp.]